MSPHRELAAPPPRGSGSQSPPIGVPPHQETIAAAAAREAKMAAARVYAAKATAAAARRATSPQSPLRGPAISPGRAEAERFQQDIRGFLRARRAGKQHQDTQHLRSESPRDRSDSTDDSQAQSSSVNARLDAYVNALDKVKLLSTLTRAEKLRLAESLTTEEFGAGENIVKEGEAADCMYLLESGTADAVKPSSSTAAETASTPDGGEAAVDVLRTYSRGDFFGELALESGGVRQATVVATSFSTTVLKLPRSAFQTIVATNAGAAAKLQQEKAAYAEASARLLTAARLQKPSDTGENVGDDKTLRQGRRKLREDSALTVQRVFRGFKARRRVAKVQVSDLCYFHAGPVLGQHCTFFHCGRSHLIPACDPSNGELVLIGMLPSVWQFVWQARRVRREHMEKATVVIQARWRGLVQRRAWLRRLEILHNKTLRDAARSNAAIGIQAIWRGFAERRKHSRPNRKPSNR